MALPVKLSDIVSHLQMAADEMAIYLNKRTGDLVVLMLDDNLGFEDEDDFAEANEGIEPDWLDEQDDWFKEQHALRREILNSTDYVSLPDKWDIHEWQIMDDFCFSRPQEYLRDELRGSIRREGAFKRFYSAIQRLQLESAWHDFHAKTYEQIALNWLEENGIPFTGDREGAKPSTRSRVERGQDQVTEKENAIPDASTSRRKRAQSESAEESVEPGSRFNVSELKVFISHRDSKCDECGEKLGRQAWITLEENKGALCLACADLDELVFLPTGNAALTRRSKKYSTLSAVVLKFSRARRRYERQGLLVEENALAQAEAECLADIEVRERRNERARERRAELDEAYIREFARRIRVVFPNCPKGREQTIAEHACLKYSGRVGRSAAAKSFEDETVRLAVSAHVRHRETNYDSLLAEGWSRGEARAKVRDRVEGVLERWTAK